MFEFFRSLAVTVRTIFEPRFVGRFNDSYKGPRSWWIHVNPKKHKHVYLIYVSRYVHGEWYRRFSITKNQEATEQEIERELRKEVTELLNESGADWMTVPWTPGGGTRAERQDVWVVASSNDDWLMLAKLKSSPLAEAAFFDHDQI